MSSRWRHSVTSAPDAVVWSPSSVVYDRDIKRDAYLAVRVPEVWLVDFEGKTAWRPPMGGEDLAIDLSEIFRGLA